MIAYWSCFIRVGGSLDSCFRFGEIIKTVKVKITVQINTDYNACILARIHAVFSAFGIILCLATSAYYLFVLESSLEHWLDLHTVSKTTRFSFLLTFWI